LAKYTKLELDDWKAKLKKFTSIELKSMFPIARELKRELHFYVGQTNSGKTYQALQELQNAPSGMYLAPLRLLALENYEALNHNNIATSLITGEEEIIEEDSTHMSCTIEMLNFNFDVVVVVIDEVQMLEDKDRGWAWINAIIGAPASKVIMTGSSNALSAVKEIASYLGEPLFIKEFKRKNPLLLMDAPIKQNKIQKGSAIITFSRKSVLALQSQLNKKYKISIIYGSLSPEVRKEEARRFREGETDILISTDAIGMGLNLPIKTIIFAQIIKFDGVEKREINSNEIVQIAGRAGRYNYHEVGYIGAFSKNDLEVIHHRFHQKLRTIKAPYNIQANYDQVEQISDFLQTQSLFKILDFFEKNMKFDGPFRAVNIDQQKTLAKFLDRTKLDLHSKYNLSLAPVSLRIPKVMNRFNSIVFSLEKRKLIKFDIAPHLSRLKSVAKTEFDMLNAEDLLKEITMYLWLSFKFRDKFISVDDMKKLKIEVNDYISRSLKNGKFISNKDRGANRYNKNNKTKNYVRDLRPNQKTRSRKREKPKY
jgi:ATP-dependent RNA helicase SUPV3L1/SUV3